MGILIKNNIVNQKGTPAFYESSLATRPTANIQGRMYIDTDVPSTGIYRDNGSSWDQVADQTGIIVTPTLQTVTTAGNTTTLGITVAAQSFFGTSASSSGILVVNTATADSHIVVIGANSPSVRIRNTASAPSLNVGLGISTASNNFIQGSVSGDYCIFNSSTTPSPILFGVYNGTNTQEAVRISSARNLIVGIASDAGYKLDVNGSGRFNGTLSTQAGNGIISGGGSYYVSPSATRGVIAIFGSTDQFLTLGTNGYIFGNSILCRFLSNPDFDIVVGGSQRLSISSTTGITTFNNAIALSNTITGSVLNTVTNKVSIVIGGVQYYLLASTSAV